MEFDAVSKYLLDAGPAEWLALCGRETEAPLLPADSDLSTVTANADKFYCVAEDSPWLVNFEPFSSRDPEAPRRVCLYSLLGLAKLKLPVFTVVILLSRRADLPEWNGEFREVLPGDSSPYLSFKYRVLRVWELAPELLLEGGIATLALAPISKVGKNELPALLRKVLHRVDNEVPPQERRNYRAAIGTLLGLVHHADFVKGLFKDFSEMRESSVVQLWLQEGREEGLAEGREEGIAWGLIQAKHEDLLVFLEGRFGEIDPAARKKLASIGDMTKLTELMRYAATERSLESFLNRIQE